MPWPRPSRPPPPAPASPDLVRIIQDSLEVEAWNDAVEREAWRLVRAEDGDRCGPEQYARGRQSLIDQGWDPPRDPDAW